jgi:hypothetical protein
VVGHPDFGREPVGPGSTSKAGLPGLLAPPVPTTVLLPGAAPTGTTAVSEVGEV